MEIPYLIIGVKQNYARKEVCPIDKVHFDFQIMDLQLKDIHSPPENGCYIYGLFLEGKI